MAVASRASYLFYNEDFNTDCIWILGGNGCGGCVQCYNISNDNIYTYDTLDNRYNYGQPGGVIIGGIAYYYYIGNIISYYIENKIETTLFSGSPSISSYRGCLTKHPNIGTYNQLFFADGDSSTAFYIFNIDNNSLTSGDSLSTSRFVPTCIVHDSYLYVIGGDTTVIERISVLNNVLFNSWETMPFSFDNIAGTSYDFSDDMRFFMPISYKNYIYLVTSYNGNSNDYDNVFYADTQSNNISQFEFTYCAGCDYLASFYLASAVLVESDTWEMTKIYCFGGSNGSSYQTLIGYSNNDCFSSDPSNSPSSIPSSIPTTIPTTPNPTSPPTRGSSEPVICI